LALAGPLARASPCCFWISTISAYFFDAGSGIPPAFRLRHGHHAREGRRRDQAASDEKQGIEKEYAMSTEMNMAKKAIHDKIESQINSVQAKLTTLKAKAEATKANAELKMIADLLTKKQAIDQKLNELKKSSETAYQQTKTDVESRVAELEKSVNAIEAKFKAA
jgi:hypothetical protein